MFTFDVHTSGLWGRWGLGGQIIKLHNTLHLHGLSLAGAIHCHCQLVAQHAFLWEQKQQKGITKAVLSVQSFGPKYSVAIDNAWFAISHLGYWHSWHNWSRIRCQVPWLCCANSFLYLGSPSDNRHLGVIVETLQYANWALAYLTPILFLTPGIHIWDMITWVCWCWAPLSSTATITFVTKLYNLSFPESSNHTILVSYCHSAFNFRKNTAAPHTLSSEPHTPLMG